MRRCWIISIVACVALLVIPKSIPSERPANPADGQLGATVTTGEAPNRVQMDYLPEPPEISPELMEKIQERIRCCSHIPIPPVPVEPGARSEAMAPAFPPTHFREAGAKDSSDFMFFANNDLGAGAPSGYTSVINEPCVGNNGRCVFQSGNWYASLSTDFGATFSFINPYTTFPSVAGGFCCDQIVLYDPSRDCLFWLLQYLYDGDYNNVQRLAVANSFSNIESQTWYYYDFTAQDLGLASGYWLDFPDLVLGANNLYLTSNYAWRDDGYVSGTSIRRLPLDDLVAGVPPAYYYYSTGDRHSFRCTHGADTVMYWATHNTTSSIRIYEWTEGSVAIYTSDVALTTWNNAVRTAPGPDGRDWLGRADGRVLGAWVSDAFEPGGAIGFMWNASQGGAYPYPYVHAARFRVSDKTLINEPTIWNTGFAFAYPSMGVNGRGHVAGCVMMGGGSYYPGCGVVIWDDYTTSPPPGWELYTAIWGTSGPYFNGSGDYLSTRPCYPYSNTWIGTAFSLEGGPNNDNARPRFLWFGRERDLPATPEPQNLYAFNGYHQAVPLVWQAPSGYDPLSARVERSMTSHTSDQEGSADGLGEVGDSQSSKQSLVSYNVYRSFNPGGPYTLIANVDREYYRDEPVSSGNTYYYVVTAVYDIVEESGYSNESDGSPVLGGYYINSGWAPAPPTLDGAIDPGEWATADVIDITHPGVSPAVTLYVMNNEDYLYLAVDDPGNTTIEEYDEFGPYYDEDHNREWPLSSPSGEGNFWVGWYGGMAQTQFRGISGWWPDSLLFDGTIAPAPGVDQAMSLGSGHLQYEVEIDLAASELNATPPDVIGLFLYNLINPGSIFSGWWPQELVLSPYYTLVWSVPAVYGDLELASVPPPQNLYAFEGYDDAVPLAWSAPVGYSPLGEAKMLDGPGLGSRDDEALGPGETYSGSEAKQTLLSYNVYRSGTPGGPYSLIANVDRQYYRDETAMNGNAYYYVVAAVYDVTVSEYSNESDATPVSNGYLISSGWASAPPVLDGLIGGAEWATADMVDITYPGVSPPVTLYVMNDDGHLYLAVDDPGDPTLDDYDQFGPYFDENHDFDWPTASPSGEGNFWIYQVAPSCVIDFRGFYGWWPANVSTDVPITAAGVSGAISAASGHVQYEADFDLVSSELNAAPGDLISWFIYSQYEPGSVISGWWPQETALSPYSWGTYQAPVMFGELMLAVGPDIDISVPEVSDTLCMDDSADHTLTISNTGGSTLDWNLSESPAVGWLGESPTTGSIPPGGSDDVTISFDAAGLAANTYSTTLVIASNDPDELTVNVPVELTVLEPDIAVSPGSFTVVLGASHTLDTTLVICSQGGGCLVSCSLYTNPPVDWLTMSDTSALVMPGECDTLGLHFNTVGLPLDTLSTSLTVVSNDPDEPTVEIPIELTVTSVEEIPALRIPATFALHQNRPNPVRFETRVFYQLPSESHVLIRIYDGTGKLVSTLVDERQEAGYKSVSWNGRHDDGHRVPSGVYFYRVEACDRASTRKMTVLR